jgi:hypothetical protein
LATSSEGRELLESYALTQKYKEAGLSSIPEPEVVKTALDKAKFYDALDEDLSRGDADAVLRGLTTQTGQDGKLYISAEGAKFIAGLPNFVAKLPDAEYAAVSTPILDNGATYLVENCQALWQQAQAHRGADGKFTPQGTALMVRANAFAIAAQVIEQTLYGDEMVSTKEDILAGRRAKDRLSTSPQQEVLRLRKLALDRREGELKELPIKQVTQHIVNKITEDSNAATDVVTSKLASMLPNLAPKAINSLVNEFRKEVHARVSSDPRYEQFKTLVKAAQGGDPEAVQKAIIQHQGLVKRIAFELWPRWSGERVSGQVKSQAVRKDASTAAGSSSSANGTGDTVPQFRAKNSGESSEAYRNAKLDHVWKHTAASAFSRKQ